MHHHDEVKESETIDMLIAVMDGGVDRDVARRVLRKFDGDVEKAASAMIEGDRGEETQSSLWTSSSQVEISQPRPLIPPRPNSPINIDLTGDDNDEFSRALRASLETASKEGPKFGPSERPPDANWAMVPSNNKAAVEDQYFQSLDRAIQASIEQADTGDEYQPLPIDQQWRKEGWPLILRPTKSTMVYAALIVQALFYIPQVRERVANWRPDLPEGATEVEPPTNGPELIMWKLVETFTNMDLAQLVDLDAEAVLDVFKPEPWSNPAQPPGELSYPWVRYNQWRTGFFEKVASILEKVFAYEFNCTGQAKQRVMQFQYGNSNFDSEPGELLQDASIVRVEALGPSDTNDLVGRLSAQLSNQKDDVKQRQVIFEPSEVLAFDLTRTGTVVGERKPFKYPKHIYLDQFLKEHVELAESKRDQQRELHAEIQKLVSHKKALTHFNDKDTLKDLRSSIYYYESVADADGDHQRAGIIRTTAERLKNILAQVEKEIADIDLNITKMRDQAATLLDCPELQRARYDLRVVLMHDGLYGRKHLYSYVQEKGAWWRIEDASVTQVSEDNVLEDSVGLHLGAGPYLLLYSRALPEEPLDLQWPPPIKVCPALFCECRSTLILFSKQINVENHNRVLFEQLQCSQMEGGTHQDEENVLTYPQEDRMDIVS
ncbi:hypothetical protein K503DRAFT_680461 [Rhizopogon vinicolor AM-OR11-026]|uniref:USP domain-containing protein n=1 Tax=Rhizopogon vinicolor AM-OR11-026 TaxID=1314800 RepID=A0A1B7NFT8_9AGAM|nr:hypothetical protein K503DRAFT_680461 [Rhizopogon vinicolor AM-OR11-026]